MKSHWANQSPLLWRAQRACLKVFGRLMYIRRLHNFRVESPLKCFAWWMIWIDSLWSFRWLIYQVLWWICNWMVSKLQLFWRKLEPHRNPLTLEHTPLLCLFPPPLLISLLFDQTICVHFSKYLHRCHNRCK